MNRARSLGKSWTSTPLDQRNLGHPSRDGKTRFGSTSTTKEGKIAHGMRCRGIFLLS